MPDESQNQNQPGPQFDQDALAQLVQTTVRGALDTYAQEASVRQAQEQRPPEPSFTERHQPMDPVAQAVMPVVAGPLRANQLAAADAKDAAVFYASHPEAARHRDKIEAAASNLMARGTPLQREDVYAWVKGKHEKEFAEEAKIEQQKREEAARLAQDVGPGMRQEQAKLPQALVDPHSVPFDELDKALKNQSF